MNARIPLVAVAACLPLMARAADRGGDLRDLVAIHPPGNTAGRITFAGIGARSPIAEFDAKFEDDQLVRRFVADFGTELIVLRSNTRDGRTGGVALMYSGEPVALRRLFDRWKEVLARAGADCEGDSCHWSDEHGDTIATLDVIQWRDRPEVHVRMER